MPGYLLPESNVTSVAQWLDLGGGEGLRAARKLGAKATIEELTASGLRGRGGGGFPTGRKWSGVLGQPGPHRYVVCNGAEGEPATFKDRTILRTNPYQVVEGVAIAAITLGARQAFFAIKDSFEWEGAALTEAINEMQEAGLAGEVPITVVRGPDEYLFGEEKAMLEVIEGRPPLPGLFPPYLHGLFATAPQMGWEASTPGPERPFERGDRPERPSERGVEPGHGGRDRSNPTLVNNVETFANVAHVLGRGAGWFRSMGTGESPGNAVATVVGDVRHAGVGEVELGSPLSAAIDGIGGGVAQGRTIRAVFSGVANAVVTEEMIDTPLSYEAMTAAGTGLGALGYVVYDDTACMVEVAYQFSRFLFVESCGQCPPCKLGSEEITHRLNEVAAFRAGEEDIAVIGARLGNVTDGARCYLANEEQLVIRSILRSFPEDFAAHLEGRCPRSRHDLPLPKVVDIAGGVATYDLRHRLKRPDWTYEDDGDG